MEAADVRDRHTFLPYRKLRRQTHAFTSSLCELASVTQGRFFMA